MDKYIGKRLDARYEVHELIGVGGMALVYKAYDIVEAQNVAIKILKDEYLGKKDFMRRFKNEFRAVAVLSHPNIVKVLNVSFGTNFQYIVMEYISGITLKEYLNQKNGSIDWKKATAIVKQVLLALSHAHSKGIVHRDIKPQNTMITYDDSVKVTDFGIARFFRNETETMTDRTIGSVHYISPEQAKGVKTDAKSDIYSVGVMLYEMLTGRLPFEADNAVSVAIMQMQVTPQLPRSIVTSIPIALEEITLRAMQKDPENRYFSSNDMLSDIEKFEKDTSVNFGYNCFIDNNPTKVLTSDAKDKSKKKKLLSILGGIAAAAILFALAFMIMTMLTSHGSRSVNVPNFVGMKVLDVQNDSKYKFNFKIETIYDSSKPEGIVVDQDPTANSKRVRSNATIVLKVNSSGILVPVPSLIGLTEEVAKSKLSGVGLKFETLMINDDTVPTGRIKNTDPIEGIKVPVESTVRLFVSKGPIEAVAQVPDVIGKTFTEAKHEIISKGFKISPELKYEKSDQTKDTVISTDPLPGVTANLNSFVRFILSSGVKKEKQLEIVVNLPPISGDITLKVYVDGTLDNSKTVVVDPSFTDKKSIYIKGTQGEKEVRIKVGNDPYKIYKLNFDNGTVIEIR
ncbi:MAG: protein kinase [Firmicutes bacterium]|nr:protein kinase [Bacillota bacterium]